MTLTSTKILRAVQSLNESKNLCWTLNMPKEYSRLLSVRDSLLKEKKRIETDERKRKT